MDSKDVLKLWEKKFVHNTGFVDSLTDDQREAFNRAPELIDICKFSDNQIKLAMVSAYLNKTSKLKNILKILTELDPKISTMINVPKKQKIYDSSKSQIRKKVSKSKRSEIKKNAKRLSSYEKIAMRKKNRKLTKERVELADQKAKIKKNKELADISKRNLEELNLEKKKNLLEFGEELSNRQIKDLLKIDIPGYEEARDHRFNRGPQDKDYT